MCEGNGAARDPGPRDGGGAARRDRGRLCLGPPPPWQAAPGRGGDSAEGAAGPPGPVPRREGARPRPAAARPVLTSRAGQSGRGSLSPAGPSPAPPGPPSGSLASGTPRRWGPAVALRGGLKKPVSGWWDPARPPVRRAVIGLAGVAREAEHPPWRQVGAGPEGSSSGLGALRSGGSVPRGRAAER